MKQCTAAGKNEQWTIVEKQLQADAQSRPLRFGGSPVRRHRVNLIRTDPE